MGPGLTWQQIEQSDIEHILAIAAQIHTGLPEREEVFADKISLFGAGCQKLIHQGTIVGYGLCHPWRLGTVPPLDTLLGALPQNPDCIFVHDIAILPAGRGQGASGGFLGIAQALAAKKNLPHVALVAVYGTSLLWSGFGFTTLHSPEIAEALQSYGPTARYMTCPVKDL